MNEMTHRPSIEAPQLRTLLLTDLCDSTTLVERIGDVQAATLFRDHDRLVLDLQQRWRGRLIDRSDGLLLLFERPIDGLGFALDYVRELREMGDARRLELRARAGLHVGEVLTWRNSDEAVQVGAKPLEVEGLAKPMAARLMAMARPGQILLSAVAEPLAHRAARELGERGQHLLWKSHGRWRFKGVPDGQQIYEVGEPGIAPLRMPPNTPKGWRDLPLWRRPAALAAEAAIIAGIGVGVWFATRPAPAIAFNQRDWVVVADLRNLTGQSVLDDSLEQAFRISLEQSRYVNVLSDLKARDTLTRMQLKPDTILDRAIASEIALRDGARAVILPTVAEVGGKVRVSAEIIDPHTQTTLYAQSTDGTGIDSALASIDGVTASLREKLGETMQSIQNDSTPLPEVTTKNLDALRSYALAQKAMSRYDTKGALEFFRRATELDPEFALAWLGQVRAFYGEEDTAGALAALRKAKTVSNHLPPRESMYLAAWWAEYHAPATSTKKWVELARLYPDYMPAQGNAAIWLYVENRFSEGLAHANAAAVPQNPLQGQEYDTLGRLHLGMEQYAQAENYFKRSFDATGGSLRRLVITKAAQRDFNAATKYESNLETGIPYNYLERTSLAVDMGKLDQARVLSKKGLSLAEERGGISSRYMILPVAVTGWLAGDETEARAMVRATIDKSLGALGDDNGADNEDDAATALSAALFALRIGEDESAARALKQLDKFQELLKTPQLAELAAIVKARQALNAGDADKAIEQLTPYLSGKERYQTRVALMDAYLKAGRTKDALTQARWLESNRGRAYIELDCGHCLQALNVADSNSARKRASELAAGGSSAAAQAGVQSAFAD
ncbi:putative peptide modification system cyclase [Lysobacter soli]|uniref:putative peptide modification system cyclase n=1 Tax=Lysobacter soli TaxID=453783 RepID=UPI0037C5CB31